MAKKPAKKPASKPRQPRAKKTDSEGKITVTPAELEGLINRAVDSAMGQRKTSAKSSAEVREDLSGDHVQSLQKHCKGEKIVSANEYYK